MITMIKNFFQSIIQNNDNLVIVVFFVIVLLIIFIILYFITSKKETQTIESKKPIQILIPDTDSIITDYKDDKFEIKKYEKENFTTKIIVDDIKNSSLIKIEYTSNLNKIHNINVNDLTTNFDDIFLKIAKVIDPEIYNSKNNTLQQIINKYKNNKSYSKHFYIYDKDNSIILEVILRLFNNNKSEIQNKLLDKKIIKQNINDIKLIIQPNIINSKTNITKPSVQQPEVLSNITNFFSNIPNIIKKTQPTQNNLNSFIQNINQSINQSLLNASQTKNKKYIQIAINKSKFRTLFIKTNQLIIDYENNNYNIKNKYFIKKKINLFKDKLNKLYKLILSS